MEQFRALLIQAFNGSELPFDAKFYILKDIYRDVCEVYEKMLKEQMEANTMASANNENSVMTEVEEVE